MMAEVIPIDLAADREEENGVLETMVWAASAGIVDFSRIILLRNGNAFDRPSPGVDPVYHLLYADQGGFLPAVQNILALLGRTWSIIGNFTNLQTIWGISLALRAIFYRPSNFGNGMEGDVLG
jgi:Purine nucleoside permease (NUP)